MMLNIQRYVKRPLEVQAVEVTATNAVEVIGWLTNHGVWAARDVYCDGLHLDTCNGGQHACNGDWVVRGVHGEWAVFKPRMFAETHEFAGHVTDPDTLPLDLELPCLPDPDDGLDG